MALSLTGEIALITGAVGAIGVATATLLAARGATIAALDRKGTDFAALRAAVADVTDEAFFATAVAATVKAFDRIDAFFSNVGVEGVGAPIPDYPLGAFRKVIEVNVIGVFLGLKLVIPVMAKAGRGSFINSSSVAGLVGSSGLCAYVAGKHAVLGLTCAAAVEWGARACA